MSLKETKKHDNKDILYSIANGFNEWQDFVEMPKKGKNKIIKAICKRIIELERKLGML
jgi:hypothetical protein